jgi:hypothetical protein
MATAQIATDEVTPNAEEIKLSVQKLRAQSETNLALNVELPAGYHLNTAAPQRYRVTVENGPNQLGVKSSSGVQREISRSEKNPKLPLLVTLQSLEPGAAELKVQFSFVYCRTDNTGTCRIKTVVWRVPVEVSKDETAPRDLKVSAKVAAE